MTGLAWPAHQSWEQQWWGACVHTFGEEAKQISYAHRMGLVVVPDEGKWPVYDLRGSSVLDLGGGPVSLLLKCRNVTRPTVVDPCAYPAWVAARYEAAGINYVVAPGEEFYVDERFDECWIYNVLQHVLDPGLVIDTARRAAPRIRLFEWIDLPPVIGHPHTLTRAALDGWLGGSGQVEQMNENGCVGRAYYGVFG